MISLRKYPRILTSCVFAWLIVVVSARGDQPPLEPPEVITAKVDALFEQSWKAAGINPALMTDDETFLRRITLDLTGLIPTVGEVRTFRADTRPDKRLRIIDDLLNRPRHASHLARLWREVLLPKNADANAADAFEAWLQARFRQNAPYDRLVSDILTARGSLLKSEPAIFFVANNAKPEELAANSSRAFLGLQVRCAQCHDHPFAPWKQDEFWGFAAFFARVQAPAGPGNLTAVNDLAEGEVRHPKTLKAMKPRFLDGGEFTETTSEPRRAVLARWMTAPDNPYFARAAVNRAWSLLFGRGLVQPVDDLGPHTTATHPEVLDLLAADFVASGFNLRRTIQIVAATKPYQLQSDAGSADRDWEVNYTAMPVRSLSAQQVYDALLQAAGQRELTTRAAAERQAFLLQFDSPTRDPLEYQGGIPQVLSLLNGPLVARLTDPTTGDLIAALADSPFLTDQQRIETLFLATVSRRPRDRERDQTQSLIQSKRTPEARAQALGDILWALLNSSEFVLNQ